MKKRKQISAGDRVEEPVTEITPEERTRRMERYGDAAAHIRRTIPISDIGGRMVMAAFMKDSIDRGG